MTTERAALIAALACPTCGRDIVFVRHGREVCRCVTREAIEARATDGHAHQLAAVIRVVDKLHEIDHRPEHGRRVEIGDGELRAACECCFYESMNDTTFLEDAYDAAGLST